MKITSTSRHLRWIALAICIALFGSTAATHAAVLAYDDLEDAVLGSLSGQTSGTGFPAGYVLGSGAVGVVSNTSLSYSSGPVTMDGGTNAVYVAYPNATVFTRAIGTQNGDSLYLSFLFRTPTADGNANEDFLSFGFNGSVGETTAGILHRYNVESTDHSFGFRAGSSNIMPSSEGTEADRTYFLVLRLRKLTPGTANAYNELAIFVDPSSVYEPVPSLVITNARATAMTHIAARVALSEAGDGYFLDNLCVGQTYDDVVFPNGSPVVVAPSISPNGGSVAGSVTVTLETATPGASIRYTTDGSTPSATVGTLYTAPFALTSSSLVQAIACKDGMYDSPLSTAKFHVSKHWTGLGADNLWSTGDNWSLLGSPAGADLVFDNVDRTAITVVNSIVDADMTVSSLCYTNSSKFPVPAPSTAYHQVTEIGSGRTLSVNGSSTPRYAMLVGGWHSDTEHTTYAKMTGGGSLVVNATTSDFRVSNTSGGNTPSCYLDLSGLSLFKADVPNFWAGYGSRGRGHVYLATTGDGTNSISANWIGVGDSNGSSETQGTSELRLGIANVLHAEAIGVAATVPGKMNTLSGKLSFQTGLSSPRVVIRGRSGGDSRANLTIGSHGYTVNQYFQHTSSIRTVSGSLDFTDGAVDARLGSVMIGEGSGGGTSSQGGMSGTLTMAEGGIDALSVVLGRTLDVGASGAKTTTSTLNIGGGLFTAGSISMAENVAKGGQKILAAISLSGSGALSVDGNVVMGTRNGVAPALTSRVDIASGVMKVHGNMEPGSDSSFIVSEVLLKGGALVVTNAAETATLRIENGTFAIAGGTAEFDRLVTTNALCTTQVELRGTGAGDYATVSVNDSVRLGGTLAVTFAGGYTPSGGEVWKIVQGTGVRTGTFAVENIPEDFKVVYTPDGYWLVNPAQGTIIIVH